MRPTFIVPDVHGHYDRLLALLVQESIVDPVTEKRTNHDVEVVQLGDLGHFGKTGSPSGDFFCYEMADDWFDTILWGNHDRGVVDAKHRFNGFQHPNEATVNLMRNLSVSGKLRFAHATHGYLLTHAGLHPYFASAACRENERIPRAIQNNPESIANWINDNSHDKYGTIQMIDAIGTLRGGRRPEGGILWRDAHEKLYPHVRQVFGHSKDKDVRTYYTKAGVNYCLDTGSTTNGRLNGFWLPENRLVEVTVR